MIEVPLGLIRMASLPDGRLMLADWLEERSDPRADVLRKEPDNLWVLLEMLRESTEPKAKRRWKVLVAPSIKSFVREICCRGHYRPGYHWYKRTGDAQLKIYLEGKLGKNRIQSIYDFLRIHGPAFREKILGYLEPNDE